MPDDTLVVHEIYRSLQGESTFVGRPCTFVRLSACNLRCRWCDTPEAFTGGTRMALGDVVERALALGTEVVEVTGGEPLLQAGALPLMRALCDAGKVVLIETSGERDVSGVDPRVHRIMDLKAPGSGESERNRWENLVHLTGRDEVKIVLADRADYEWAREVIAREDLPAKVGAVLLSPVWGALDPKELAAWVLEDELRVRVQVQLHKIVWGADTKGV
jgi:7-carboxy-7-deazaguanine synthase